MKSQKQSTQSLKKKALKESMDELEIEFSRRYSRMRMESNVWQRINFDTYKRQTKE